MSDPIEQLTEEGTLENTINEIEEDEIVREIEEEQKAGETSPDNPFKLFGAGMENFSDFQWNVFAEKMRTIPESIKYLIFNPDSEDFFEELSVTYNLSPEQSVVLTTLTRETLLGDLFIGDIASTIESKLGIPEGISQEITGKVVRDFLGPAISDIKAIQKAKFAEKLGNTGFAAPAPRSSPKTDPTVNQNNVIDLRNQNQQ